MDAEWDKAVALEDAFNLVHNKTNWKDVIDAVIPADKVTIVTHAIQHYAGGGVEAQPLPDGTVRITAPGYWKNGF